MIYNFKKSIIADKESTNSNTRIIYIYNEVFDETDLMKWTNEQEVKIITLDGSYGGRSGKEYQFLTTDYDVQDEYHLGKSYGKQSWFRYPIMISNDCGRIAIRKVNEDDDYNGYLVVSKRSLRDKNPKMKRMKTDFLEKIAYKMVEDYINFFNNITSKNVYSFTFIEKNDNVKNDLNGAVFIKSVNNIAFDFINHKDKNEIFEYIKERIEFENDSMANTFYNLIDESIEFLSTESKESVKDNSSVNNNNNNIGKKFIVNLKGNK